MKLHTPHTNFQTRTAVQSTQVKAVWIFMGVPTFWSVIDGSTGSNEKAKSVSAQRHEIPSLVVSE